MSRSKVKFRSRGDLALLALLACVALLFLYIVYISLLYYTLKCYFILVKEKINYHYTVLSSIFSLVASKVAVVDTQILGIRNAH